METGRAASEWLTLGQAARYLGVAPSTIRTWSDDNRVPFFKTPGGHRRYRRSDLDAFLEGSGRVESSREAGPCVLIVDDDAGLREFVRANLELEGYSVREAGSAREGLAALDEQPPDLILLDVMMPELDGFEVCRALRSDPATSGCTIVMLTANELVADKLEAFSAGADDYMLKPFSPRDLVSRVRAAVRRRSNGSGVEHAVDTTWVATSGPGRSSNGGFGTG